MKTTVSVIIGLTVLCGVALAVAFGQKAMDAAEQSAPLQTNTEQVSLTTDGLVHAKGQGRWSAGAELDLSGGCCGGCSSADESKTGCCGGQGACSTTESQGASPACCAGQPDAKQCAVDCGSDE